MKNLKALFIITIIAAATSMAHAESSSKQLWLKFNGTNYCKPGFCAESIPNLALAPALQFYKNNQGGMVANTSYIGIIDFTIQSTKNRFFILNLKTGAVESMLVTHGKKSETSPGWAGAFSNVVGSEMSSLGFFITDVEPYYGKHGISLKLDGVSDTNKNARERLIVLHGADYATQWFADTKGRLGLSQGCPAVAPNKIEGVIKKLKGQGLLYIHANSSDL
ncbi:murein L,D-transpeptidase catalytic domain family protein [Bacteriovorax sp. PP10]|uniref:Murein L,D-transpeptidase catalytic domain family protein n=1 Tax=Bacteriovorax antarcticus TaxID=3088717 RepID=A0ABU5VR37_9BACT|nr:murein L,D-transpeptidase catalytic domain family protein [Bacteriovorax sp. PP10]MEA9355503.1 murein L,D-transpeptidase catalytic domain family protein [Bacteriovorax sp. PP10]